MAYFRDQPSPEKGYSRRFGPAREDAPEEEWEEEAPLWDDGFDELMEEDPEPEISEEERRLLRQHRFRIAANLGDVGATLVGLGVILALVAFLISMLRFLTTDISQNFSLLQTKF